MKRWVYIGLFASLALNLFLVGVIVAGLFWHGGPHHRRGPFNMRHAYSVLTPASQTKAKAIWQAERAAFIAKIREVRAARREVRALLREDKPDIAGVETAIAKVGRVRRELHDMVRGIVKKIADALPAAERVTFYKAVLKRRGRFRRRHREP
jgi:uncharacterized membrane protein